jgi:energy-coupling factor transporter ATP-binding protein EcfA2
VGDVLVARGLGLQHRGRWVFRDLDLTVQSGQIVVLTGPSGSGRTSALLALSGHFAHTHGTVDLAGRAALGLVRGVHEPEPMLTAREHLDERLRLLGRRSLRHLLDTGPAAPSAAPPEFGAGHGTTTPSAAPPEFGAGHGTTTPDAAPPEFGAGSGTAGEDGPRDDNARDAAACDSARRGDAGVPRSHRRREPTGRAAGRRVVAAAAQRLPFDANLLCRDLSPLEKHLLLVEMAALSRPDLIAVDDIDVHLTHIEQLALLDALRRDGRAAIVTARAVPPGFSPSAHWELKK